VDKQDQHIIPINEWVEWLNENKKVFFISLLGAFVSLFVIFYFIKQSTRSSSTDYLKANECYQKWIAFPEAESEDFHILQKTLSRHPELQGKYDALIAKTLLLKEKSKEAETYAARVKKRAAAASTHHASFAEITFLIAKGELQKALKDSYLLKEKMEKDSKFWSGQSALVRYGSPLYAYTLLRIAMLEQSAGTSSGEIKAWEDLENYLHPSSQRLNAATYHPESAAVFEQAFRVHDVSLNDYIQHRKKTLVKN